MVAHVVSLALPGMLHLVMLLAALYPTVDVVVGERVRGTAETLLVSGAPRAPVVLGKLLAVLSLTVGAVVANAGAMGLTLAHLMSLQGGNAALDLGLSWGSLALAGLVCLGATGLVVGVMTLAVTPARSFKEGQSAGNLVVTAGAVLVVVGMLPLTQLTPVTAFVPLANSVLVLRSALVGELPPALAWLALAELLALTWLVLRLAGRTLSRPDTLLGR
jgi:sodium transport system permease protein